MSTMTIAPHTIHTPSLRLTRRGRLLYEGESAVAGLELGRAP